MNTLEAFQALDIRTGTIITVEDFPEAKKPLFKITVDFGAPAGHKTTAAGLKPYYSKEELMGKTVVGAINLPEKNIAGFPSQFLMLGVLSPDKQFALLVPDHTVPPGLKVF